MDYQTHQFKGKFGTYDFTFVSPTEVHFSKNKTKKFPAIEGRADLCPTTQKWEAYYNCCDDNDISDEDSIALAKDIESVATRNATPTILRNATQIYLQLHIKFNNERIQDLNKQIQEINEQSTIANNYLQEMQSLTADEIIQRFPNWKQNLPISRGLK